MEADVDPYTFWGRDSNSKRITIILLHLGVLVLSKVLERSMKS